MKTKLLKKLRKKHSSKFKIVKIGNLYRLYYDNRELYASTLLKYVKERATYRIRQSIQTEIDTTRIKIGKIIKFYPYG